jgi:hypothetical protein
MHRLQTTFSWTGKANPGSETGSSRQEEEAVLGESVITQESFSSLGKDPLILGQFECIWSAHCWTEPAGFGEPRSRGLFLAKEGKVGPPYLAGACRVLV